MNASSSNSEAFSVVPANGPRPSSVNQTAMAQTAAFKVATSRCRKRNAAQMMKGRIANGCCHVKLPLNIAWVKTSSGKARLAASRILDRDQVSLSRADQLRTSGATMMMPVALPCHQVHQFHSRSGEDNASTSVSGTTATVAAIAELTAAIATNLATSSPRWKVRCTPMNVRTSAAPASACKVLPVPISTAASSEDLTVTLTSIAQSQIPGQIRFPSNRTAARAMPDGGHTAVA